MCLTCKDDRVTSSSDPFANSLKQFSREPSPQSYRTSAEQESVIQHEADYEVHLRYEANRDKSKDAAKSGKRAWVKIVAR